MPDTRFVRERAYGIDEARRFAGINGLKLCRHKETGRFEFLRAVSPGYEPATWEQLKEEIAERGLSIQGTGTHLRVVKVSGGML